MRDSALVEAARAGDAKAYGDLIERNFSSVYVIALARLRDPDMAEDLTQEVFLRAYLHLDQLTNADRFEGWVCRMSRNLAIDWLRRGQRVSLVLPMVPLDEVSPEIPDSVDKGAREIVASKEQCQTVRDAILDLPPDQREVVLLHFTEDLTQQEIAKRLGVNQATVSRQLRRALNALRGTLEPALRETAITFKPSRQAVVKSLGLVAAVGIMSTSAKATLAASATVSQWISAAETAQAGVAGAFGVIGFLQSLPALITGGVKVMATGKGIAAAVAAVVLIGGGAALITQGGDPERRHISEITEEGVYALTSTDEVIPLAHISADVVERSLALHREGTEASLAEEEALARSLVLPTVPRDMRLLIRNESIEELAPSGSPYDIDVARMKGLAILPHQITFRRIAAGLFEGTFETPPGGNLLGISLGDENPTAWAALIGGEEPPTPSVQDSPDLRAPGATVMRFAVDMVNSDRRAASGLFADLPTINAALEQEGLPPMDPAEFDRIMAERERRLDTLIAELRGRDIRNLREDWSQGSSRRDEQPHHLIDNMRLHLRVEGEERTLHFNRLVLQGGRFAWDDGQMVDLADGTQARLVGHWALEEGAWLLVEGPVWE